MSATRHYVRQIDSESMPFQFSELLSRVKPQNAEDGKNYRARDSVCWIRVGASDTQSNQCDKVPHIQ
jgi:hypothetical protein